jgi:hypothetical protein
MSLSLPPPTHPLRDLFDVKDLASFGTPEGLAECPTFKEARLVACNVLIADKAISSVNAILLGADGCIGLWSFSSNHPPYLLWNFGKPL